MLSPSLEQCLSDVLNGNREAYRQVIEACEAPVRLTLTAIVPDNDVVEDLAQETFLIAYSKLKEYQHGTDFTAWIRAIARNLAFNERKRWHRAQATEKRYAAHLEALLDSKCAQMEAGLQDDLLRIVRECAEQLQAPAKQIVQQRYFENKSNSTIAATEKRTPDWVRLVLYRARAAIAECLRRKGAAANG